MDRAELTGGYVFDIQGFSVHDGPGCRTLIFLKGCPLHCLWCSNPEGIAPYPEPLYNHTKCTFDRLCIDACKAGAITVVDDRLQFDRKKCSVCQTFDCVNACCTGALKTGGYFITADDLYARISRDRQYWGSGGGITLTGGEPFLQPGFVSTLLKQCYAAYIHTAVETCGQVPWSAYEAALPFLDWIFFDLKQMDPEKFSTMVLGKPERMAGASSPPLSQILSNAKRLAETFPGRMVFRLPLIPGFNDDPEHLGTMAEFINQTGRREINILPVHHFGREKYTLAGRTYYTDSFDPVSREALMAARDIFSAAGITCYTGSDTPF
jgi:glycyl-radical enzyme activating protein